MLTFTIDKQNVDLEFDSPIVADTKNYITASFTFSSDWNGLTKVLHFRNADKYYSTEITDNAITSGLSLTAGVWEMWLHGYTANKRITTNSVKLEVARFADIDGEPYPEIPASSVEKLIPIVAFNGDGSKFLANDGTYKTVSSGGGAVNSVNGKVGTVVLTASDVNALPASTVIPTVPTTVSSFTNDSGYLTLATLPKYEGSVV